MELWVRSQDRERICRVNKLYIKGVGIYSNCDNYNDDYDYLGLYKTKERALEVLDEIQKYVTNEFKINGNIQEADVSIKARILSKMVDVYQMPGE